MAGIETVPNSFRNLRAYLLCSLIKTMDQFEDTGCENCEEVLQMKGDPDKVRDCTSANFDGMISLCDQEESWVARWQKINTKCKGIYAISVSGTLPRDIAADLKAMRVRYRPNMRDKSQK